MAAIDPPPPARTVRRRPAGHLIAALTLIASAATGCQKEAVSAEIVPTRVFAPEIEQARERGKSIFFGQRGGCSTCHMIGTQGTMIVGPNLGIGEDFERPVWQRCTDRRPNMTPPEYVMESMLNPDAVVVEGYAVGTMRSPDDLPIPLPPADLATVAVFVVTESGGDVSAEEAARLPSLVAGFRKARRQ